MWLWIGLVGLLLVAGALILARKSLKSLSKEIQVERARELFKLQRERIEAQFLTAAEATGKPRGLRWKDCAFEGEIQFARDRRSGELLALDPVVIQFEAVEGSDMEGVAAVGNLRNASAVFFFQRGQWQTSGKAVFNLNPTEVIEHFKNQYERVAVSS
jgi:hypothetical protein